jgi:two-component system NtrC family sensor kinase
VTPSDDAAVNISIFIDPVKNIRYDNGMKSLRTKLIINFIIIVFIIGAIASLVGVYLIGEGVIKQAQEKIRTDLNSAREIYARELNEIKTIIRLTAERVYIKDALLKKDYEALLKEIETVRERESLDILSMADAQGRVIVRPRNPALIGDDQTWSSLVKKTLTQKEAFAGTEIILKEELVKCSPELVKQAYFKIIPTERAKQTTKIDETSGMAIKAAAPILDVNGNLLGILYGGNLINRDYKIVDKIKETVFQGQRYKGKDIGTATIFQDDLRISTNVRTSEGERAIGTRIAADVGEQVLVKGQSWVDRAFVVNNWYFTAYEPIKNIDNKTIGILYVGILEDKFVDIKKETVWLFVSITIIGVLIALVVGYLLANSVTRPIRLLSQAAHELAKGNFNQEVAVQSQDEIGELGKTFNFMTSAIKERDEKLKNETQQTLMHMEKMSSLGQMAAGAAHEINNPLSGVLTYTQLILKNLRAGKPINPEDLEKKLATMEKETERCTRIIKSLLDFSRQSKPSIRPIDLGKVIENSLVMLAHQAALSNVQIVKQHETELPKIEADPDQLQQVFTNIILNAIHAMAQGGTLAISTIRDTTRGQVGVRFKDTGIGIPPDDLKKLFTPFFTTKEKGKGIGLGLAVCYGIIQRHEGDIKVESESGKGTIFTVWLKEKQASKE